jgi:hypothetical protein
MKLDKSDNSRAGIERHLEDHRDFVIFVQEEEELIAQIKIFTRKGLCR